MGAKRKKKSAKPSRSRRIVRNAVLILVVGFIGLSSLAVWFVHHPRAWLTARRESWPRFVTAPLFGLGNPIGDITDGLGLTGHDAVYEYDEEAPVGEVLFAGAPKRTASPAPKDIVVLDRGVFLVGWSPSLKHPVWCAYHVPAEAKFDDNVRPSFTKDPEADACPTPTAYDRSGYDRGHMVPNHAIESRYGEAVRKLTFRMSNIAPQTPALNRGVWRDLEHRIADLWTARYGEIWVIVGCLPGTSGETLSGTAIDVPEAFYQVVVAQNGLDVRAQAILLGQDVPWGEWAARNLISIDELEELTGFDFLPELPAFIQDPLEAERPSRLWPVRFRDVLKQFLQHYRR